MTTEDRFDSDGPLEQVIRLAIASDMDSDQLQSIADRIWLNVQAKASSPSLEEATIVRRAPKLLAILSSFRVQLALAACLLIVVSMAWDRGTANIVFAQVQQSIDDIKSAKIVSRYPHEPFRDSVTWRLKDGDTRTDFDRGLIQVYRKKTHEIDFYDLETRTTWTVPSSSPQSPWSLIEAIVKMNETSIASLGTKQFQGKSLVGFQATLYQGWMFPMNVWVDPSTKRPLWIEQTYPDRIFAVHEYNMEFAYNTVTQEDIDRDLPTGFRKVDDGPLVPAPRPSEEKVELTLLQPGEGIGPLLFGDSSEKAIETYGKPSRSLYFFADDPSTGRENFASGKPLAEIRFYYDSYGLQLSFDANQKLQRLHIDRSDPPAKWCMAFGTPEHVTAAWEWKSVETLYGPPSEKRGDWHELTATYQEKGMEFESREGHVRRLAIFPASK